MPIDDIASLQRTNFDGRRRQTLIFVHGWTLWATYPDAIVMKNGRPNRHFIYSIQYSIVHFHFVFFSKNCYVTAIGISFLSTGVC